MAMAKRGVHLHSNPGHGAVLQPKGHVRTAGADPNLVEQRKYAGGVSPKGEQLGVKPSRHRDLGLLVYCRYSIVGGKDIL